jgi:deoxyinosine 3'endonuclease (endonuclease V)
MDNIIKLIQNDKDKIEEIIIKINNNLDSDENTNKLKDILSTHQDLLKTKIDFDNDVDIKKIKYIGGVDISFDKKDSNNACAYLTIVDFETLNIVYECHVNVKLDVPYLSGFLGFREVKYYLTLVDKLRKEHPEFLPDVIMVDGFGILHHRGFGSASHLGVLSDIPTIGIGKTILHIDGLNEKDIKCQSRKLAAEGIYTYELKGTSGKIYGMAYMSTTENSNPIYVSIGHKLQLNTALHIVKKMCKYRIPEPIRNSDIKSKLFF